MKAGHVYYYFFSLEGHVYYLLKKKRMAAPHFARFDSLSADIRREKKSSHVDKNRQMEEEKKVRGGGGGGGGCGRNCLSKCCLLAAGARFPLYALSKIDKDFSGPVESKEIQLSFLDRLREQWDDRMRRGLFHYDITTCEQKVIPGEYGFITRLIEGRDLKKRPTEFRIDKVLQPFDATKFNFTKIGQEEALFRFEESENKNAHYFHDAPISASASLNIIAINVSPIGNTHVLLIPRILDLLPQRLDRESFLLALYLSKEAGDPYFKVGYNSLGAFATINHLHFQAFYLPMLLPAEKAVTENITTLRSGVRILRLLSYPVKGLAFEHAENRSMQDLVTAVYNACIYLQDNEHPYNVLISDSGRRVYLFMQCYAEKRARGEVSEEIVDNQVNPATWEISGYMVLKRRKDYEEACEENILSFLSLVSVSEVRFQELQASILDALHQGES